MEAIYAIVGVVGGLIVLNIIIYLAKRASRRKCKKCKTHYNYDCVDWNVESTSVEQSGNAATKYAYMRVVCTCPNCGAVRKFRKKFRMAHIDERGSLSTSDVETSIRKYLNV